MFILSYVHRYGTDLAIYETEELAKRAACNIISDWFSDFSDLPKSEKLANLINAGEYSRALSLWAQMDHMETITIQECSLVMEVPFPPRITVFDIDEE